MRYALVASPRVRIVAKLRRQLVTTNGMQAYHMNTARTPPKLSLFKNAHIVPNKNRPDSIKPKANTVFSSWLCECLFKKLLFFRDFITTL